MYMRLLFSAFAVTGSQNSRAGISNAVGHMRGNIINNYYEPPSTDPDPGVFHATLVYSKDDVDDVKGLQSILQGLQLCNGNKVRVALEEVIVPDGVTEVEAFDQCLLKSGLILLFITKNFIMSRQDMWKGNVALTESLRGGKNVIPIFTEDKDKATYLEECYTLRSVRGIDYHKCKWREDTKKAFLKNFENFEKQREEPGT